MTDPERFAVISGNDSLILWTLLSGGVGGIANVCPAVIVGIYENWRAGNLAEARRLQDLKALSQQFGYKTKSTSSNESKHTSSWASGLGCPGILTTWLVGPFEVVCVTVAGYYFLVITDNQLGCLAWVKKATPF